MEESFAFFTDMRNRMLEDSQIKIAYQWRKLVESRRKKEEAERAEIERKRKSNLNKKNSKNSTMRANAPGSTFR